MAYTQLNNADLTDAQLNKADLSGADLSSTSGLQAAVLSKAKYNTKAGNLIFTPTQWPQGFDPKAAGAICVDH